MSGGIPFKSKEQYEAEAIEQQAQDNANRVFLTPKQLQDLLKTAITEATKLNPIEERKLNEELERERKRSMMMVQLGKIEEEAARRKREGCSHMRYPAGAGRLAGMGAPRGAMGAEWCTGGQAYQDGTAMVICLRCSSTWLFRPDPNYYTAILQNGLLGEAPPPPELTLCSGCFELMPKCRCAEVHLGKKAA